VLALLLGDIDGMPYIFWESPVGLVPIGIVVETVRFLLRLRLWHPFLLILVVLLFVLWMGCGLALDRGWRFGFRVDNLLGFLAFINTFFLGLR
jgi:hypothetical protein